MRHRFERPLATRLPILVIFPSFSLPPLEWGFGVNPIVTPKACFQHDAARSRAALKFATSGTLAAIALAVIGPMPGTVCRRLATSFDGASALMVAVTWSSRAVAHRA